MKNFSLATTRLATLVASGAIAVGYLTIGIGFPSIAAADPNNGGSNSGEWDIGAYDSCLKNHPPYSTDSDKLDWYIHCCWSTGGMWGSGGSCQAPPGEASSPIGPGQPPQRVTPPNMQAPPAPVIPTAPVNPGSVG
ncbi:MAG TPA: hypothetical protein VFB19_01550 [Mycobacterium sp.]|nr:hypothetical protein [Mycobacterium sp.]